MKAQREKKYVFKNMLKVEKQLGNKKDVFKVWNIVMATYF